MIALLAGLLAAGQDAGGLSLVVHGERIEVRGEWEVERVSELAFAPAESGGGLVFNGASDMLTEAGAAVALPREAFTVSAWVSIEAPLRWGGIVGAVQDNGGEERGWVLGFDEERFTVGLSTVGADDGDGVLTYLRGETPWVRGRWHHVAARYDGHGLELWVDGRRDARSEAQSGPVLPAPEGGLVVGAYVDRDELHPLDGRLLEVRIEPRALSDDELRSAFQQRADLTRLEPWDDTPFDWLVSPFLTWPALDGMSVGFETTEPSSALVRYRPEDEEHWREVEVPGPGPLHSVRLTGLEPDRKYFYQVLVQGEAGEQLESPTSSFRTAASPGRAFTFVVIGDTQSQGQVARRVADLAYEHRPNLLLHAGDLVSTGSARSDWTHYFFVHLGPLLSTVPMMPVLGNHEQDARYYYDYMSLPEPERWYSFRYGDAEFFMIDGNRDLAQGSEQLAWLEGALGASRAAWRFAVLHQPPWTSDSDDYGATDQGPSTRGDTNVRNIVALLERHGVDICFSGHVHDYERTFPILGDRVVPHEEGGVVYITAAGGGGHLEDFDPSNTWFGHKKVRRHHLVYVALHGPHLELQAIDEDGRLFDVLTLRRR